MSPRLGQTNKGGGLLTTQTMGRILQESPERVTRRLKRAAVITAICDETEVSRSKAKRFLSWLTTKVHQARQWDYEAHYLTEQEIEEHHDILVTIAPDGAVAEPGSAHMLVEDFVLDRKRGEMGLLHDMIDEEGTVQYCTVQVRLSVAR